MEVDRYSYYPLLREILASMVQAEFISFDLEMSGIPARQSRLADGAQKPNLQQHYTEIKAAAEKYQILQLGITCVRYDEEDRTYVAQPYNFNLSPVFLDDDRLEINRDFTFSSSAMQFLMKNSFDIGPVLSSGVPYLSRSEVVEASRINDEKDAKRANQEILIIDPSDTEALEFYRKARKTVTDWLGQEKWEMDFVNIGSPGGMNGYQRRLVHQLIRGEFPKCRTFAMNRGSFMQVEKLDVQKEARIAAGKQKAFDARLIKQIGLRYIIEALAHGDDIDKVDSKWSAQSVTGAPVLINETVVKSQLEGIKKTLQSTPRILVGHNLFMDLVFIYRTFFGLLPAMVDDFQAMIHELFPKIIDTKYLDLISGESMRANTSLTDLCHRFKDQTVPRIKLDVNHYLYSSEDKSHEAGYDSYLTTQVFIKLSAQRFAKYQTSVKSTKEEESRFSSSNPFDKLANLMDSDVDESFRNSKGSVALLPVSDGGQEIYPVLPGFEHQFWSPYWNKLRVGGTIDEVCDLNGLID